MSLRLSNVEFRYNKKDKFCLGPINIELDCTGISCILGSNGSGKSTLLKILTRQFVEFGGKYYVDNIEEFDIYGEFLRKKSIGYLPEKPLLDDMLSGYEILSLVRDVRNIDEKAFDEEIKLFKEYLAVEDWFYSKKCDQYSLGMCKKTALMLAMIGNLRLTILDEPTNGLDPIAVYGLKQLIKIKSQKGMGIILTSHILDFIEKIVEKVIILNDGKVIVNDHIKNVVGAEAGVDSLDELFFKLHK